MKSNLPKESLIYPKLQYNLCLFWISKVAILALLIGDLDRINRTELIESIARIRIFVHNGGIIDIPNNISTQCGE